MLSNVEVAARLAKARGRPELAACLSGRMEAGHEKTWTHNAGETTHEDDQRHPQDERPPCATKANRKLHAIAAAVSDGG
jgi:hypothetical protein